MPLSRTHPFVLPQRRVGVVRSESSARGGHPRLTVASVRPLMKTQGVPLDLPILASMCGQDRESWSEEPPFSLDCSRDFSGDPRMSPSGDTILHVAAAPT